MGWWWNDDINVEQNTRNEGNESEAEDNTINDMNVDECTWKIIDVWL